MPTGTFGALWFCVYCCRRLKTVRLCPHPTPHHSPIPDARAPFFAVPESEELDDACSTLVRQLATVKSPSLNPTWSSARHISLSRTVVLRMHQIDGFIARLKHHVRNTAPFQVEFDGLQQYCNEDRSKGFLGWVRTPEYRHVVAYMPARTYVFTHNRCFTFLFLQHSSLLCSARSYLTPLHPLNWQFVTVLRRFVAEAEQMYAA